MTVSPKVILRHCPDPDPERVAAIVSESFQELGASPRGKVLVKPNVVTANREYIRDSYTHPGVLEGLVRAIQAGKDVAKITLGESSGYGVPPGLFLHEAGYDRLARKVGVTLIDFNHDDAEWVSLRRGAVHSGIHLARSVLEADTRVWVPKLKYHICCQITNAVKLNIGLLQHRDRMAYHDDRLNEKIVDLLEVGWPDLVVTDAIHVGHGYESAPRTVHVGALLVANHPLAADAVAAAILGYAPEDVVHLRIARDRGYGSLDLNQIEIVGDVSMETLRCRTGGIESAYQDIQKVDTPIAFYCGDAPERGAFCYGGCLAAVKGCLGTIDKRRPGSVKQARPGAIVTGVYAGDVIHPEEPVLLVGDCTRVEGRLEAKRVKRLKGCPIGTVQLLFGLPGTFHLASPAWDARGIRLYLTYGLKHLAALARIRIKARHRR